MKINAHHLKSYCIILLVICMHPEIFGQTFYFGNDLSYVNEMEDCGADYKENNVSKDVYQIFADHGTNLVRVRLWVDPTWQDSLEQPAGVKPQYSDYEDVRETIKRSKDAGMQVLLDFQLSDVWADPGRQIIPVRWWDVAYDIEPLKDSVYNYVVNVLSMLQKDTLMPELVQIGNETNDGIMKHITSGNIWGSLITVSSDWNRHAQLFNAAIQAVRDVSDTTTIKPKIALHCAGLESSEWWYNNIIDHGVTDFDIMGLSYYYAWHDGSIKQLGNLITSLLSDHPGYDLMILETGYLWTTQDFDGLANIITTPDPSYLPVCPGKQLEYMIDLTREVMNAGGIGVIFWEPAWVSTPCRTPWGQGSSHDHVAFFDPVNTNFMENGGGRWTEPQFYEHPEYKKVIFKVNTRNIETPDKIFITGDMTEVPWSIIPMYHEKTDLFNYSFYLPPGDSGTYYFMNDSSLDARETVPPECATGQDNNRFYKIGNNDTTYTFIWGTCLPADYALEVNNPPFPGFEINVRSNAPDNNSIHIEIPEFKGELYFRIIDMNGKILFSDKSNGTNNITIDKKFMPGIYICQISNGQFLLNNKFIIY